MLLPDRDNTAWAYEYTPDGRIVPSSLLSEEQAALASATLALVGLDKKISLTTDSNGKHVALDRPSQRMEVRLQALNALEDYKSIERSPLPGASEHLLAFQRSLLREALSRGHFSIWMAVFAEEPVMRRGFLWSFQGTLASGCFDPETTLPLSPAPNPDGLPSGGKL